MTPIINPFSLHDLTQNLRNSGLFSVDEIESHLKSVGGEDGEVALQNLLKTGVLTAFQCDAVQQRGFDELRIGNYDVLGRLGAGGMGAVYQARHRRMKRMVALKVMNRNLCKDEKSVQRFQREVETIARFQHPNIVLAFDPRPPHRYLQPGMYALLLDRW